MMDCKKALVETNGDIEQAIDWLRKKGMSSAAKKADREVNEGSVAIANNNNKSIALELSCETDFVAKNEQFQALINEIALHALETSAENLEELLETIMKNGKKVKDFVLEHIDVVGENLSLKKSYSVQIRKVS